MDDKLPKGVVLEMVGAESADACQCCYFFPSNGKCPREPDKHNFNRLSCVNERNIIFKELGNERE